MNIFAKSDDEVIREIIRCRNPAYFTRYCKIDVDGRTETFNLWDAQRDALHVLTIARLVALLKARQIGMTTLVIAYVVHYALYHPGSTILLFSKGAREAKELLRRIRRMIRRLPDWLQPRGFRKDTRTELELTNGSYFISFGSAGSGGDSYTAQVVVIDEADLVRDLDAVLSGAKPTIDAGGQLILLSRTDKTNPSSSFKRICRAALDPAAESQYQLLFLPWWVRPGRTEEWYQAQRKEIEQRTFSLDAVYEAYPATPEEALAPRELDKRFPRRLLLAVYEPLDPLDLAGTPFAGWQHLELYVRPVPGRKYVIGIDVAGGNPNSDDSVAVVVDKETLEESAVLCGKIEPTVHAHRSKQLADFYNNAEMLPEKNHSHGAKCLEALKILKARILFGHDRKAGWFTDIIRKNLMYDTVAEAVRTTATIIHSKRTLEQLASLDVTELAAPFGEHDDRAVGYALAVQGSSRRRIRSEIQVLTAAGANPLKPASAHQGIRWIPTYATWIASVEHQGQRLDVGDYDLELEAAAAVNAACQILGLTPPNRAELMPEVLAQISERVRALLTQHGV